MTKRQLGTYQLFLLEQDTVRGYDTYNSAVVVAVDEAGAKMVSPCEYYRWHDNKWYFQMADGTLKTNSYGRSDWCLPKDVKATWIGIAGADLKLGEVVCASFNAG